jgi:hypothetical protein
VILVPSDLGHDYLASRPQVDQAVVLVVLIDGSEAAISITLVDQRVGAFIAISDLFFFRRKQQLLAWVGAISTRELIEPIFAKTVFISLIATFLFAYLGSSNILAPFDAQAQRLVSVLAWIWPVLPTQYGLVRQVQGVGQWHSQSERDRLRSE